MELLGPSLDDVLECYEHRGDMFRPDTVLRASRQLLEALDFINKAGIAHGDISPANVAFTCKNALESDEDLFEAINGDPEVAAYTSEEIPWSAEWPKHLVQYVIWPRWYENYDEDLRLIDLGTAFPADKTVPKVAQPQDLRSPETFFIGSFDYRHDLWRAGCVIYTLFYQKRPFDFFRGPDDYFIRKIVMEIGPLPPSWQTMWEEMRKHSKATEDDICRLLRKPITETFGPRLDTIISSCNNEDSDYERDEYSEHDYKSLACLLQVMEGLLQHEPDKRLSAQEAASYIQAAWTDYRRDLEAQSLDPEEDSK